jgi:formate dehydrogenase maturation protein FdhE
MTPQQAAGNEYDARIRRAEKLISEKSSASELLSFYKRIASFQKSFLTQIAEGGRPQPEVQQFRSLREGLDVPLLLPHFRNFLSLVEQNAPNALAAAAREIAAMPSDSWMTLLSSYWDLGGRFDQQIGAFAQFLPRAFLQAYAAYVAGHTAVPPVLATPRVCPLCGGRALFGVLRIEGDGGKRCMVCSFCTYEWEFRRILCPTCGEEEEKKLPGRAVPACSGGGLRHVQVFCSNDRPHQGWQCRASGGRSRGDSADALGARAWLQQAAAESSR